MHALPSSVPAQIQDGRLPNPLAPEPPPGVHNWLPLLLLLVCAAQMHA
jgi:hypothetical protein